MSITGRDWITPQMVRKDGIGMDTELLGLGLYSPSEAARYARVRPEKFSRWIFSDASVFNPQLGKETRIVTFIDFAQSLSVLDIRLAAGVPLQKIRKAYRFAQENFGVEFPLGVRHGMFIFGDINTPRQCDIGIFLPQADGDEAEQRQDFLRVQLSGKKKGSVLINEVVQEFSRNIVFDGVTHLADKYIAHQSHGFRIVMDPEIRFGKPYVEGVGYEAATLAGAATAERGIDRAARLFRVKPEAIRASLDYCKLLEKVPNKQPPKPVVAA